jgi:hypothetical protein
MITYPSSIRVGVVEYRVTTDPDEWLRKEHQQQRTGNYGYSDHQAAIIYLNPDMHDTVTRLTLWHEVLHCVNQSANGGIDLDNLGEDGEEKLVRMLEGPTLAVLRDNPDLVKYLTA